MGYRITYESVGKRKRVLRPLQNRMIVGGLVLVLVFGAMSIKSNVLEFVKNYLLPGDPAVTAAALEEMAEDLWQGESIVSAFREFCEEIIENGNKME